MFKPITEETLQKLSKLHDKIKNHEFRKSPEKWLLDEYFDLYDKTLCDIIGRYVYDTYELSNKNIYLYYRSVSDRWLHYTSPRYKDVRSDNKDCGGLTNQPRVFSQFEVFWLSDTLLDVLH